MSTKILGKTILDGIMVSQERYEKMSGGLWLDSAPEYFITSQVALHLNEKLGLTCTLEEPMVNLPIGRGAPGYLLRRNGRADIAIWDDDENVTAIVEVKNNIFHSSSGEDLHRLAIFSRRVGQRPVGVFAYFQTAWGAEKRTCQNILERAQDNLRQTVLGTVIQYDLQIDHQGFSSEPIQYDDQLFYGYLAHVSLVQLKD